MRAVISQIDRTIEEQEAAARFDSGLGGSQVVRMKVTTFFISMKACLYYFFNYQLYQHYV